MQSEHERDLNVLRGILYSCEEGASDELSDGSDGNESWSEADRQHSRETADWLRRTFFELPEPCTCIGPERKRIASEQIYFSDEKLWDALDHADDSIRRVAADAMETLADLAAVRARFRGTSFLAERRDIFDTERLLGDLRSTQQELHDAAELVFCEVMLLEALIEEAASTSAPDPADEELRERVRTIVDSARARLAEMEREQPEPGSQP